MKILKNLKSWSLTALAALLSPATQAAEARNPSRWLRTGPAYPPPHYGKSGVAAAKRAARKRRRKASR